MKALRKKTARYIADNAEAIEKDDLTLREELLQASGGEFQVVMLLHSVLLSLKHH